MRTQSGIGCVCSSLQPRQRLFSDDFTCEAADKEGRGAHNCFITFADALRKSIAVIDLKKEPPPRLLGPSVWALRCQICGRVSPWPEVRGLCCGPHNSDTRAHEQRETGTSCPGLKCLSAAVCCSCAENSGSFRGAPSGKTHFASELFLAMMCLSL